MTKVLEITDYGNTTLFDFLSGTNTCVFAGESGRRPLKSNDGTITKTLSFRVTAATKALARAEVNTFIDTMRQVERWLDGSYNQGAIYLKEAADGETAVKSLILGCDANAVTDGSAIDAYQTQNIEIYVDVALTLLDHREVVTTSLKTLTVSDESAAVAIGKKQQIYGGVNTDFSRILIDLTSTVTGVGAYIQKLWIGMMPYVGDNFQHIWEFDYATNLYSDTTETTSAGSYGTNIAKTTFAFEEGMARRARFIISDLYNAINPAYNPSEAAGEFLILLRYKIDSGSGSILAQGGVGHSSTDTIAYNEPALLNDDGAYHFAPLGVLRFPPNNLNPEVSQASVIPPVTVTIAAQRLSGTATLVFDTLTLIPYRHFASIENLRLSSIGTAVLAIDEQIILKSYTKLTATQDIQTRGDITEQRDFLFPVGYFDSSDYRVQMVYAGERDDSQIYGDNLDNGNISIYEAFEAYNV